MIGAIVVAPELSHHAAVAALTRPVGGVPLLLRQARLLRALGVGPIVVVAPREGLAAVQRGLEHRLALEEVEIVTYATRETAASTLERALQRAAGEAAVLLRAEQVFERGAARQLVEAAQAIAASGLVIARDPGAGLVGLVASGPARHLEAAAWLTTWTDGAVVPERAETVLLGGARPFVGRVVDEGARGHVEHLLWEGCRKPLDGIVSRNLNRHLSLFVSRRIAHTAITPNHVSSFCLVLGLLGAACAAQGTYLWVLLGAFLLKANSVLDGVDGELARMRVESSVLGEWLDTVSDDLSNQSFFLAVGLGAWRTSGSAFWMLLALVAVLPLTATSAVYYRWLIRVGRGDVLAFDWFQQKPQVAGDAATRSPLARATDFLTEIFRRDSFVMMVLVAALLGVLEYSLFVVAPAAWVTFVALVVRMVSRPRSEPAASS